MQVLIQAKALAPLRPVESLELIQEPCHSQARRVPWVKHGAWSYHMDSSLEKANGTIQKDPGQVP